ncbi:acetyl/propionyl/methylcrotonyl-CoA carboxylase subunit alpha [Neomegalonema sp.]|uniref:acetyl/propionyl/methylcrotonyl-CoA carboxylase subunit alpha n=1 Tax=Neomegalonema sp. TaxID=2039713 RepID=UPI00261429AF|nr:acetyl/propionyl/methylcrotonyl-CoA carboxylase subunit alpha [Neomegalonema sp.]MDD2870026.1 acetyl/propionyl/methylcrotonyl-CoA carboxylase subunit alpha [Neomegalonema sp.]
MMESLLIANRGEIARRILRTAKRLGVRGIAVYSEADADMPFVKEADEAVLIGPAPARESYLVQEKILEAARKTGAQAIHPGYGFLSENAEFAEAVEKAGLIWVGAPPSSIRAMGLKDAAKRLMQEAGVPVTPGYLGEDQSEARLASEAAAIGWPVLIKAVAGGGGKGMRRVDRAEDFLDALTSCRREAAASFGDDRVLLEKYILNPRHIEVQVFGDQQGGAVHLFERDCSLQRRHQKVIEEAPAPGMDPATREALCAAAVRAARAVDYVGAGTIEFIADGSEGLRADRIWFMEMNTRLQVEHPVTEEITGEDLVEWQLRVACGEPLPKTQDQIQMNGWAMEARLYAENPTAGFLPSIGRLEWLEIPSCIVNSPNLAHCRVEAGVEMGGEVSPYYDPMIAKLIVHAPTREEAARNLAMLCAQVRIWPVRTNAAFLARAASDPDFIAGRVDTGFIERHADRLVPSGEPPLRVMQAAVWELRKGHAHPHAPAPPDPWDRLKGFRLNADPAPRAEIRMAEQIHWIDLEVKPGDWIGALSDPWFPSGRENRVVFHDGEAWAFDHVTADDGASGAAAEGDGQIFAPMPGQVVSVEVAEGGKVAKGQKLLTLTAMKMEHALTAPFDGTVTRLAVKAGDQVTESALLAVVGRAAEFGEDA